MEHKPVNSSNIKTVAYDPETKTMEIAFHGNSGTYSYADVPKETYDTLLAAESPGKHFHASVKGKFKHTKL